ncbi:hypothetical protein vBKpnPKlyazma_orf043 [Klebsiella phage vB_KpnP_Klyazma]|nr:hypothetical protein vBKpnPKlyazma_orf043 [Klebsiella phage vB_KpnP_Klyazma]UVM90006.1 MAG: hypothetical protein [Bacteriophage sp.]
MKEIVLTVDVNLGWHYNNRVLKAGTVLNADTVDEHGFASVNSLDTGFFENEWEEYIPTLENK